MTFRFLHSALADAVLFADVSAECFEINVVYYKSIENRPVGLAVFLRLGVQLGKQLFIPLG